MTLYGLLHSDIPGSMCACHSPRLFAAYRVLRRLLMPRHSPYALISLHTNSQNYVLFSKISLNLGEVWNCIYPFSLKFYFTKNLDILISSLLFRYSIFNELSAPSKHLKLFGLIWWAKLDSNQWPLGYQPSALTSWAISPISIIFLVEIKGIEPLTPCLQSRCSPSWAKPPYSSFKVLFRVPSKLNNFRKLQTFFKTRD